MTIARVEPLTTSRALRGPFDYLLPEGLAGAAVGSLLVVPFGRRKVLGVVVGLAERSELAPERLAAPLEALEQGVPADLVRLAGWMAEAYCSTPARALSLVLPPGAGRGQRARLGLVAELTPAGRAALDGSVRLTDGQRTALAALAGGPRPAAGAPGGHAALRRLATRGLVALERRAIRRRPAAGAGGRPGAPPPLSDSQRAALDRVRRAMAGEGGRELLLHGVTGSGKTEVYLRAAHDALRRGRGVIVLVPEIGLTPQTVGRFQARFGDTVAVLHSQLGQGERFDEWGRLRRGEARVAVGPRSAVFAPVADLGLVVVDEEHDASYKHEGDPRYDARTVAARRARLAGAVLLAGSATPRPESWRALERLSLPDRVTAGRDGAAGALPRIEVLDMREARHPLHPRTREALDDVRRAGGKAIVLLNRRGWSNFLSCRACGAVRECPQCDVALVLHRSQGAVACHHCGHRERATDRCPACGSPSVARHGAGTERVEAELAGALGSTGFPVFRLDADAAGGRGAIAAVLRGFDAAPAGVLVGTQMVAKGHDFPDVTLGVVLDADATLRFPDFRSEERTFAMIAQLAGRAGRGPSGGRVLVQTLTPDASSIARAARHDAEGFLAEELARREALRYPPYAELIRVVCSSPAPAVAAAAAHAVREAIVAPGALVLGPAPLFRLRGRDRAQVVVKAAHGAAAVRAVGAAVDAVASRREHREAALSVDVDPQ
ncbi:MAG TPA: primosomal protein N' [Solirubrobacteraceae bacterium]|nr:primosomal protein N' [Solirubrobacteraceae bacterium]